MSQSEVEAAAAAAKGRGHAPHEPAAEEDEDEESEGEGAPSVASSHSFIESKEALELVAGHAAAAAKALEPETEDAEGGDGPGADDDDEEEDGDDEDVDEDAGADGQEAEGAYAFKGCSKRPASVVLRELAEAGLLDSEALWEEIKRLTALTCVAMQPELAVAYRSNFPSKRPLSVAEAAAAPGEGEGEGDNSKRAFQVLGIDILIDKKGMPRLLEVNSNPSMLIDYEHEDGTREPSPVDILVKRRVVTDVLRYVVNGRAGTAASGRRTFLEPVVGGALGMPSEWTLLDRARRVFQAVVKPSRGSSERGMSSSQFVRLCQQSGMLEPTGLGKADLELLFLRITNEQFDHRTLGLHSFARALTELADLGFPAAGERRADRLESLLDHMADGGGAEGSSRAGLSAARTGVAAAPATTARTSSAAAAEPGAADGGKAPGAEGGGGGGGGGCRGGGGGCGGCGEVAHLPGAIFCHRCGERMRT